MVPLYAITFMITVSIAYASDRYGTYPAVLILVTVFVLNGHKLCTHIISCTSGCVHMAR